MMHSGHVEEHRRELANFLRTRRERLSPDLLGLPKRARRRTPGLRREEVAELIGVGVTWYTWLEQGRDILVSVEVLENLAAVLRLDGDERAHLFLLARRPLPPTPASLPEIVRPVFRDVLTALDPCPAHIRDHRWNVLVWNRAESLLVDWEAYPPAERNVVWHHFAHPEARHLMVNWESEARTRLALFRMESGAHVGDPWFTDLIDHLQEVSAEFRHWWSLHEVRQQREQPIEFRHPHVGHLILQPVSCAFAYDPHLTMRVLMPLPEADTAAKLHLLVNEPIAHSEANERHNADADQHEGRDRRGMLL
ncbi:MAG: helix-turn-helix transcriptional regulator [Thermomicrobiales bacterium]